MKPRRIGAWTPRVLASVLACLSLATSVGAQEEPPPQDEQTPAALFAAATTALAQEKPTEAIARFEALADRGVVDAVISYDRGLAYAARVRAKAEQPGDLGRAAHAFEEARDLTRDRSLAKDALAGLTEVRAEVARRRARGGDPIEIEHGSSPGRAIVKLLAEETWLVLAFVFALGLSVGIVVRARASSSRAKVAGTTTLSVSGVMLLATALVVLSARDDRMNLREGVVIAPNARLLDDRHIALQNAPPIPEGARVRVLDASGEFTTIAFGSATGQLPVSAVLPLARP